MKLKVLIGVSLLVASTAFADSVVGVDRILCSTSRIVVCFEGGECVDSLPWEFNVPQFVVIDTKKKTVSTTKASNENRSTPIRAIHREEGTLILQGIEGGRAFGFVIDEITGLMTVSVARDGLSVSVFGACTNAKT
jgi:hypothetical protein